MGPRCGRKSLLGHDHHLNGDLSSLRLQRNMRWGVKMHVVRCRGIEECGIDDARTFFGGDECQGDFRGLELCRYLYECHHKLKGKQSLI